MNTRLRAYVLIAAFVLVMLPGCATVEPSDTHFRRFTDLLAQYPQTGNSLQLRKLTSAAVTGVSASTPSPDVFVMVHPAYSLFFREANKSRYPEAKYKLLANQFNSEARFIRETAGSGSILILIIPGNYESESIAPSSYITYLNSTASRGASVFYLVSESASNGTISMNAMIDLYHFLERIKAGRVLIGGGFIGRCQRQFYNQAAAYLNQTKPYIVPEISVISPDDVSEKEARRILESIERRNYASVRELISKKQGEDANLLSIPPKGRIE